MVKIEEIIQQYANQFYVANIIESYGEEGEKKLNELTTTLREIYKIIDIRKFKTIYVLNPLKTDNILADFKEFNVNELLDWSEETLLIEITNDKLRVKDVKSFEPLKVCEKAIVYEYSNFCESFFMLNGSKDTLSQLEGHDSYYLSPAYKALDDALTQYKLIEARTSSCLILRNQAWTNANRVVLKKKPEWILRDSLFQFLKSNLRNYREVLREQNVNEKKPIDIKISWNYSKVALIEVKWIGMSGSGTSYMGNQAVKRVNEGAEQLVEYLNLFNTEAPSQNTRGYLVTFDARRDGVKKDTTEINRDKGLYFKNDEILISPDYPKKRNDFEPHVRIFLEPKCQV